MARGNVSSSEKPRSNIPELRTKQDVLDEAKQSENIGERKDSERLVN